MTVAPDVLIVGGGVIGLAIALELRLRGASVTVVTRDFTEAASHAAAGMLAPQAEKLPFGAMQELCLRSRSLYPDWTQKLEALTGLPTGYWPCGILAPVYEEAEGRGQKVEAGGAEEAGEAEGAEGAEEAGEAEGAEEAEGAGEAEEAGEAGGAEGAREAREFQLKTQNSKLKTPAHWLDRATIDRHQAGLSQEVIGGWWYPDDAQVDNRALTKALWAAACDADVALQDGVTVQKILHRDGQVVGVQTADRTFQAAHYVLATGAWSQDLLPLPVIPRKGQMLSVRVPAGQVPLKTVLFGSEIYLVPRRDGRMIIGATNEAVGFTPDNTPAGVQVLLQQATRLYPALGALPLQELWWGFRPATPDELPLLGASPYDNLTLATGHYRNGILLAPVTAQLLADRLVHQQSDPLLDAFHWSRFNVTF